MSLSSTLISPTSFPITSQLMALIPVMLNLHSTLSLPANIHATNNIDNTYNTYNTYNIYNIYNLHKIHNISTPTTGRAAISVRINIL